MRLIDADKLKRHYSYWGDIDEQNRIIKQVFDDIVDVQPTIESRLKGKWRDEMVGISCSNCKEEFSRELEYICLTNEGKYYLPNYCPVCGADMRGEE